MRSPLIVGLFACVAMAASQSSTVSAEAFDNAFIERQNTSSQGLEIIAAISPKFKTLEPAPVEAVVAPAPEAPKPPVHTVAEGETLSSIAEKYQAQWKRLYDKNTQLELPDVLKVGDQIIIPLTDEQLVERALPTPPPVVVEAIAPAASNTRVAAPTQAAPASRGSSNGNTYTYGYCTWYVKNMRPDLPNNLGNADTWVARAAAQGLPTGSTPQVGAVGQQGMHVVYVQSVNGDGTVTVSEMNFTGWNQVSSRTVSASSFQYIY